MVVASAFPFSSSMWLAAWLVVGGLVVAGAMLIRGLRSGVRAPPLSLGGFRAISIMVMGICAGVGSLTFSSARSSWNQNWGVCVQLVPATEATTLTGAVDLHAAVWEQSDGCSLEWQTSDGQALIRLQVRSAGPYAPVSYYRRAVEEERLVPGPATWSVPASVKSHGAHHLFLELAKGGVLELRVPEEADEAALAEHVARLAERLPLLDAHNR